MFVSLSTKNSDIIKKTEANYYQGRISINGPIRLTFETVHPDDPEQNFIVTIMEPNASFMSVMDRDDPNNPTNRKGLHTHECFELMFVIKGEMYQNIEYKRHVYPKGSLCLVNKKIHHAEEFSTDFRCVFLMMTTELINSVFFPNAPFIFDEEEKLKSSAIERFFHQNTVGTDFDRREYIDFIPVSGSQGTYENMYRKFDNLTAHMLAPELGSTFAVRGIIMEIFNDLMNPGSYSTIPISIGSDKEFMIFDSINSLMLRHNGRISRSQLEKELSYSGSYLNAICKKYSGLNLFDYGMRICMEEACSLLSGTRANIADISESLGFTNRSHFYSIFKTHYGMTPAEFRTIKKGN